MQLVLPWQRQADPEAKSRAKPRARPTPASSKAPSVLQVGAETYPLTIARHRRARRYVLRVTPEGGLRLTVPRGASVEGGLAFAQTQGEWIASERLNRAARQRAWDSGTLIWFRGVRVPLTLTETAIAFAGEIASKQRLETPAKAGDVRAAVEWHLRRLATVEFPPRCLELASQHGLTVGRVSVKNQRSRWGSCSTRGTISLNWRLVQMPPVVAEYVILHELMHIKQANHSRQFWREVAAVCDDWRAAEAWLRTNGRDLL
ncbi:MAG: M48 family metallopeptidase [Acidobacteria bacterium]|jgi:predicted metal-dependent hydrolase|nr:M48 family metallopeptidase [Acidobacteriota bacterium]